MIEYIFTPLHFMHQNIAFLNNSKIFTGVVMILLNIGSKFVSFQFNPSTEEYIKTHISKQLLVFAMAWMGTRDIYIASLLTLFFIIISEYLLNHESKYCIVPQSTRTTSMLLKGADINNDGIISDAEIQNAISILERAKRNKLKKEQIFHFTQFHDYMMTPPF